MRQLRIHVDQHEDTAAAHLDGLAVELAIAGGSWDPRSRSMPFCGIRPASTLLLRYENLGTSGRSEENSVAIRLHLMSLGSEVSEVGFSSERVAEDFRTVWRAIAAHGQRKGRSLTVAIDLSVIPRYVSLGLLAQGFLSGYIGRAVYYYETAIYPDRPHESASPVSLVPLSARLSQTVSSRPETVSSPAIFTEGRWRMLHVPGLRGDYRPSQPRHYLLGLGFEGDDTYRVVQQQEPDRVTAVIPDPPVTGGLESRCVQENDVLIREWVGEKGLLKCGATDALGMATIVRDLAAQGENLCCLPLGTKPHGLGMAIGALQSGSPVVLYRWPEWHRESGSKAGGRFFVYDVRDLAAL